MRIYQALRAVPPVTRGLLAGMSVIFVLEILAGGASNPDTLIALGASLRPYFFHGEWWRLVMPMFLHLSIVHLLFNLLALYIFGPALERTYGGRRFALIYLVSGMGGSLASMLLSWQMGAGASGAIMGVCGALAVTGYLRPWALPPEVRPKCRNQILNGIALTLAAGMWIPHIDNWAHLGGLISGAVLALTLQPGPGCESPSQALGWSLTVPLCIVCFSMTAAANYYGLSREVVALEAAGEKLLVEGSTDPAT
jgi:rhomboid protease GluP